VPTSQLLRRSVVCGGYRNTKPQTSTRIWTALDSADGIEESSMTDFLSFADCAKSKAHDLVWFTTVGLGSLSLLWCGKWSCNYNCLSSS